MTDGIDEMPEGLRGQLSAYVNHYQKMLFDEIAKLKGDESPEVKLKAFEVMADPSKTDDRAFSESFIEFYSIIKPIFELLYGNNENKLTNEPLGDVLKTLNEKINLSIPLEIPRVKDFFDKGINIISDATLLAQSSRLLRDYNVDLRKSTITLLDFFVNEYFRSVIDQIGSKRDGVIVKPLEEAERAVRYVIRYRPRGAYDTNEIAFEAIQELTTNLEHDEKSHLIVILFTNQAKEEFERIEFKINSVLFENAPEFGDRIKLCAVNLYMLQDFKRDLLRVINQLIANIQTLLMDEGNIDSLFPGLWRNDFVLDDGKKGSEFFQVRNGNQYYILRDSGYVHVFNLDMVSIDSQKKTLKFRKVGVGEDRRKAFNDLSILSNLRYQGVEFRSSKVTYSKVAEKYGN